MKCFAIILCVFLGLPAAHALQAAPPVVPQKLDVVDADVVDQTGAHLRFNTDIIKNRTAVVSGFFTNCTSMCPITQQNLSRLAKLLGKRMGKDVVFVSVSVDAANDTPEKMKAWGDKFHIGPGWVLVSGDKPQVDTLLRSLGLYVELPQRHQSAVVIGNPERGWSRASAWAPPTKLQEVIEHSRPAVKPGVTKTSSTRKGSPASATR